MVLLILTGILLIINNYLYVPHNYIEDKSLGIESDDLSIELNFDKENYTIGESINASIKIINNNEVNITSNLIFHIVSHDLENIVKSTESQWIALFRDETLVTVNAYSEKTIFKNYDIPMYISTESLFVSSVSFVNKVDSMDFDVKPLFDVVVDFPKDVDVDELFNVSFEVINNCDEEIKNITVDFKVLDGRIAVESFMESIDTLSVGSSVIFNWTLFFEDDDWFKVRFDIDSDNGGNDVIIRSINVWDSYSLYIDITLSTLIVEKGGAFNVSSSIYYIGYKPLYNVEVEIEIPLDSGLNTSDPLIKTIDILHPRIQEMVNWTIKTNKTGSFEIYISVIDELTNSYGGDGEEIQVVDELAN